MLAEWAAEGEEGHIPPSEGGRLLSPFREVAAGALLSCGGQLLGDLDQDTLLRLNLSIGDLSLGVLNRSRISEALSGANASALLRQAESTLVHPQEVGSGARVRVRVRVRVSSP